MADRRYTINACTVNLTPAPGGVAGTDQRSSLRGLTALLLDLLSVEDVKATFFVDSTLTGTAPELLSSIIADDHEIGLLLSEAPDSTETLVAHKRRLETTLRHQVNGCRILPIGSGGSLPLKLRRQLIDAGFVYSSSVYPPRNLRLGVQNSKRRAWLFRSEGASLWELPVTAWRPMGIGLFSIRSADPSAYSTWTISRNIEGMNRHGEPALITLNCPVGSDRELVETEFVTLQRLRRIFSAYRFGTISDAFASRLTLRFEERPTALHRRTGIVRCDARTAMPFL